MQEYPYQQHSGFPFMRNHRCCPFCSLRRLMCGGSKPCMSLRRPYAPSCFTKPCVPLCKPFVPAQEQMMPQQAQPQQTVSIPAKPAKNSSAEIWSQLIDALRVQPQQEQSVPKPIVQGQFAERLEQLRSAMQARIKQAPALETAKPPSQQRISHTPPQSEPTDKAAWGSPVNDAELSAIKAYEAL